MRQRFDSLLDVSLRHEYFHNGLAHPALDVLPTRRCSLHLQDHGLMFRKTERGFLLLYPSLEDGQAPGAPQFPLAQLPPLQFVLRAKNVDLLQYVSLPVPAGRSLYAFHNRHTFVGPPHPLTHPDGGGYASADDRWTLVGNPLSLSLATQAAEEELHLFGDGGEVLWYGTIEAKGSPAQLSLQVALDDYVGTVRLVRSHGPDWSGYVDPELVRQQAFGVLTLTTDAGVPSGQRFVDGNGHPVPQSFELAFRKPQTHWRYLVVPRNGGFDPNQARIAGGEPVAFGNGPGVASNSSRELAGETAFLFESAQPMPLQQQPITDIELQPKPGQGGSKALIAQLPNPRLDALRYDPQQPKFYSDIYVYV